MSIHGFALILKGGDFGYEQKSKGVVTRIDECLSSEMFGERSRNVPFRTQDFFDLVGIEDPRITEFCAATCEPSPHATLRTCLLRNFGAGDRHIHTEVPHVVIYLFHFDDNLFFFNAYELKLLRLLKIYLQTRLELSCQCRFGSFWFIKCSYMVIPSHERPIFKMRAIPLSCSVGQCETDPKIQKRFNRMPHYMHSR